MSEEVTITNREMWDLVDQFNAAQERMSRVLGYIRNVLENDTLPPMPSREDRYFEYNYELPKKPGEDWCEEYRPILDLMDSAMGEIEHQANNLTEGLYSMGRLADGIE